MGRIAEALAVWRRRARRAAADEQDDLEADEFLGTFDATRQEMPWARRDADVAGDIRLSARDAQEDPYPFMMLQPRPQAAGPRSGRHRKIVDLGPGVTRVDITAAHNAVRGPVLPAPAPQDPPRPGAPASRPRQDHRSTSELRVITAIDEDLRLYLQGLPKYDDQS